MKPLCTLVVLLAVGVERSLLLVDADSMIAATIAEQDIDALGEESSTARIVDEENDGDESREDGDADDVPAEEVHLPWPASLAKAARIGAIMGGEITPEGRRTEKSGADDVAVVGRREGSETTDNNNANAEEGAAAPRDNPKMMTGGCHWGSTMGCKKGKRNSAAGGEANSSSSSSDENNNDNDADGAAGLAGSASARIEARVASGRVVGPSRMLRRGPGTSARADASSDDDADDGADRPGGGGGGGGTAKIAPAAASRRGASDSRVAW